MDDQWYHQAACNGMDSSIFFPSSEMAVSRAKRICNSCPVIAECAEYAKTAKPTDGVWHGKHYRRTTSKQRREVRELHENGVSVEQIALEVGVQVETVRNWVASMVRKGLERRGE